MTAWVKGFLEIYNTYVIRNINTKHSIGVQGVEGGQGLRGSGDSTRIDQVIAKAKGYQNVFTISWLECSVRHKNPQKC